MRLVTAGRRAAGLAALLAALAPVPVALGHAKLVRTEPAGDTIATSAPAQLELHFSEELDVSASTARATGATGARLDTSAHVDLDDRTLLVVDTPTVPAGLVTVQWHAVADDDKGVTEGSYSFTVAAPTAGQQAAAQGLAAQEGAFVRASGPRLYWIGGGTRHHVPNLAAFGARGAAARVLQAVDDATLAAVPEEEDVVWGSGPDLFLAVGGVKVWIPALAALAAQGYQGLTFRRLPDAALGALPTRNDLVEGAGSDIFVLWNGQRYHQETLADFTRRGFQWGDLRLATDSQLASWPEAEAGAGHMR